MAISKNLLLKNASGKIGEDLVVKQRGGKTILSAYPDMSNRKLSSRQKLVNKILADANYEARGIIADIEKRDAAQVRLNVTRNRLYTSLVKEIFKAAWTAENP